MKRNDYINKINHLFNVNPVVALLGPRQCGKTTMAKQFHQAFDGIVHYFDLENPIHLAQLESPMLALEDLTGLIVIDEIQRRPNLFPPLRVLIDQHKNRRFLILGSASRDLIQQSSETLAGRISYLECTPFNFSETHDAEKLLIRGGFPRSYLAENDQLSYEWRGDYITTFLERDIPNLGFRIPPATLRRFWMMLAHYHGQIFNASELGGALGTAHTTIRHYLDILVSTFMVRELHPWFENIQKRQVKSSKIYFRDNGIYLTLMNIPSSHDLKNHPKLGATWEGFAMEQIIQYLQMPSEQCYFWAVHQQAELDLLIMKNGKRLGFEFKYQDAPAKTNSMVIANEILKLDHLFVIYPAGKTYLLDKNIQVISLEDFINLDVVSNLG